MYKTNDKFDVRLKVKKILFKSDENFFKIMKVSVQKQENKTNKKDLYLSNDETLNAEIPLVNVGDVFEATVVVTRSNKYGYSLKMIGKPREITPSDDSEMIKYLTRKLKGVGKKTATLLVKELGLDVINIINNDGEDRLIGLGIPETKAQSIAIQVMEHKSFDELTTFLNSFNIPMSVAILIYEKLGFEVLTKIKENPYIIDRETKDVPFFYSDIIAQELGKNPNDVRRLESAVMEYLTRRNEGKGDIFVLKSEIMKDIVPYMNYWGDFLEEENESIQTSMIENAIENLIKDHDLTVELDDDENQNVYLTPFAKIENNIVKNVYKLIDKKLSPLVSELDSKNYIHSVEQKGFSLSNKQREAIISSLSNNMTILTGGPGTGKTYTTNMIVNTLKNNNPKAEISLLAPTGKASKRLSELTKMDAMTIHRKLKVFDHTEDDEHEVIEEDLVVVDETSMVDAVMFNKLMNNLGENTRLLLVGDVEQLPSIGAGLILKDLIDSAVIPVIQLTEVFRQAQDSQIISNAHKLIKGIKKDNGIEIDNNKGDMYWVEEDKEEKIRELLIKSVKTQMTKYNHKIEDIVVLSPMRKRGLGTNLLNKELQKLINPKSENKSEIEVEKDEVMIYRENDRVIHLTNDIDKGITNGEVGTIKRIYHEIIEDDVLGSKRSEEFVEVEYDEEKTIKYRVNELDQIELAYAMSIHKSQGSEFDVVIMPVDNTHLNMLQRNLIYTGMTRAKKKLIVIGQTDTLNSGIGNIKNLERHTRLKEKLQSM